MDLSDSGCFSFKCSDKIANICPEAACFPWFMHSACNRVRARSLAEFISFWCGVAVRLDKGFATPRPSVRVPDSTGHNALEPATWSARGSNLFCDFVVLLFCMCSAKVFVYILVSSPLP